MRTWLILLSALAFTACSGDSKDDGNTDDTGPTTGDDDDDDDVDPVDAILALTGDTTNGMTVYDGNCAFCHSADGSGGTGTDIRGGLDVAEAIEVIYFGKDIMSGYGGASGTLSDQEIADVHGYIQTL